MQRVETSEMERSGSGTTARESYADITLHETTSTESIFESTPMAVDATAYSGQNATSVVSRPHPKRPWPVHIACSHSVECSSCDAGDCRDAHIFEEEPRSRRPEYVSKSSSFPMSHR